MAERHQIQVKGKGCINTFDVDITTIRQMMPVELQSVGKLHGKLDKMPTSTSVDNLIQNDALQDSHLQMLGQENMKRLSKDELDDSALVMPSHLSSVGRHILQVRERESEKE